MVELLRVETKLGGEQASKQLARSAADQYKSFLKSRAVFAPPGDFRQRRGTGSFHSFRAKRLSDARIDEKMETDASTVTMRRSHSSDNLLDEGERCEQPSSRQNSESESSNSSKRGKIEYFKQLFSKKSDKPKKHSPVPPLHPTLTLIRNPPESYPSFPSDVSTSDYASDYELDEVNSPSSPHYKLSTARSPKQLERNSKIASIVKRFESPSTPNPVTSSQTDEPDSQALMDIQAITSGLSSLVSDIHSISGIESTSIQDKDGKLEVSSNSADEPLSKQTEIHLDAFLTNLSPPESPPGSSPSPFPPIDALESDTNTEIESDSKVMDEVNSTDEAENEIKPRVVETMPQKELISTHTRQPFLDLNAKRFTTEYILEHPSPKNKLRSHITINPPSLLPLQNPLLEGNTTQTSKCTDYIPSSLPTLTASHRHSRSLGDITETDKVSPFSPPQLVITPPSPFPTASTPFSCSDLPISESDDSASVHSMPVQSPRRHRYTGYSLPRDQSRSVSDRIRSLISGKPIDFPTVDKLSVMRAAIESQKLESKSASVCDRSVLVEVKQPEDLSVRSLRDRFEQKMKHAAPEGILLSPAQLAPNSRRMSEDLIVKPTFAGDTKAYTKQDILSMQREYNTDEDANTNKSLFQPKYTIR